ncbi:response regulator transcription factor [Spirosoma sp. BT702]|uniref:Response regulator transcription factor n=1 Tax=Spirosoma profusum TaxID=2771354 RepID=A0A927AMH0_9BACT|nr:response regulator transcription factor [Spirosoma profusum]MBD2699779.1 response regulator transcription factor [Spirosoma profusum]
MIKLILADDHQLVRRGFRSLLESLDFVEVVGEASNGQEVIDLLRSGKHAQVVLMDVEMPMLDGISATEQISRDFLGVSIIMLTMLNVREVIQAAVGKGAKGFLFKNASQTELSEAIRRVAEGGTYFTSEVASILLNTSQQPTNSLLTQLSEREVEILKLVAEGYSSTEIGEKLFISPRTVDTHRNNLIQKLNVNGIVGLVRFAIQQKLVG